MLLSFSLISNSVAKAEQKFGAFGPEGPRYREQLWVLPSGDPSYPMRATLFRPEDGKGLGKISTGAIERRPLVIINHGTAELTREAVAMPVFYWLSRWFLERGHIVLLPQRRGHGATGGPLVEARGNCADPDHLASARIAAEDIAAAVSYMTALPFVDPTNVTVVGVSTGGFASLALAERNPPNVSMIVNFAGGRGGHAGGRRNAVCAPERLIEAARTFGASARIPTIWLYSRNDSYFGPELASSMAGAWNGAGGTAELHILPAYGTEGHSLADDRAGWLLWGAQLERFMTSHNSDPGRYSEASVKQPTPTPAVSQTDSRVTVPVAH